MVKEDVISLIRESAAAHGVHDTVTDTEREVFCRVKSVKRMEYYNALNAGHMPELVFEIPFQDDYEGERILKYRGVKYYIIRTYETETDGIELTAEREDVNTEAEGNTDASEQNDG